MTGRSKAIIGVLLITLIWGSSFAVTKHALQEVPPIYFAFLRFGVASLCLLLILLFRKKKKGPQPPLPLVPLIWLGLTGITFYYLFFNISLVYTSASAGALIQAFIPVIIVVLAAIFLKERFSRMQLLGLAISVAGVILVALMGKIDASSPRPLWGNLLMLLAVIAWAVYTVIAKKIADADALKVTFYLTLLGALFFLPFVVVSLWGKPLPVVSPRGWLSIIYLGAMASAVSYLVYNLALKELPASLVGVFINLDPVIGAGIAVIFLGESISWLQIAGALLVLLGVWLSARSTEKAGQPVA